MDLDCYFVSAERCRYPYLNGKEVVVVKGSDKQIFSKERKEGVLFDGLGAFNSTLEFKNKETKDIFNAWREEFISQEGVIYGTVIAKSYEAKAYGIKTGMLLREALQKRSHLIVLKSDHLYYQQLSNALRSYLQTKIPVLEQYSIDEFFGDLTGWVDDEDTYEYIKDLQSEVLRLFNLPITIAAAKSKWRAKLAVSMIKPYGIKVLRFQEDEAFVKDISINKFPGVGRAIGKKLASYHVKTIQEAIERPSLFMGYGKTGRELYRRICGSDNEPVHPGRERKGVGIGRSFKPVQSREEIHRRTTVLVKYLSYTIIKLGLNPTTFHFKIRYEYGFKASRSISVNRLFNERVLNEYALRVIKELDTHPGYKINYIGISSSNFAGRYNRKTYSVVDHEKDSKMASLSYSLTKIRDRYGIDAISYGVERAV
jgi:DNA polymerase-4